MSKFLVCITNELLREVFSSNQILWNNDGVRWEISSSKICKSNWVLSSRRVRARARESLSVCVVVVVIAFTRVPAHFRILCCIFCKRRNSTLLEFQAILWSKLVSLFFRWVRAKKSPSVCVVVAVIVFTHVAAHFRILCCIFFKCRNSTLLKFQADE